MHKYIKNCPVCSGEMYISELTCEECHTVIHSKFETCRFCRLNPEQMQFIELFLKNRGNISSVAAELKLAHPTVSRRLEAILHLLGLRQLDDEESESSAVCGMHL